MHTKLVVMLNKLNTHSVLNKDATKLIPEPNSSTFGRYKIKCSMHDDRWLFTHYYQCGRVVVCPPVSVCRCAMVWVPHTIHHMVCSLAHIVFGWEFVVLRFAFQACVSFRCFASNIVLCYSVDVCVSACPCVCVRMCARDGRPFCVAANITNVKRYDGISMWQKCCLNILPIFFLLLLFFFLSVSVCHTAPNTNWTVTNSIYFIHVGDAFVCKYCVYFCNFAQSNDGTGTSRSGQNSVYRKQSRFYPQNEIDAIKIKFGFVRALVRSFAR